MWKKRRKLKKKTQVTPTRVMHNIEASASSLQQTALNQTLFLYLFIYRFMFILQKISEWQWNKLHSLANEFFNLKSKKKKSKNLNEW